MQGAFAAKLVTRRSVALPSFPLNRISFTLFAVFAVLVLVLCAPAAAGETEWGFETDIGGWTALGCSARRTSKIVKEGSRSLELVRSFPGTATIQRLVSLDVTSTPKISYHIFVPEAAGSTVKTLVFLKNKDGLWYQCVRHRPLFPGRWSRVEFDLSPQSSQVQPLGHFRRWSNVAAAEMQSIGIKVFSGRAFNGGVRIDKIRLEPANGKRAPLAITGLRPGAAKVPRFAKFELVFDVNRSFANPFDPDVVTVEAEFTDPKGRKFVVAAFYSQDFVRVDRVTPMSMTEKRKVGRKTVVIVKNWRLLEDFVPAGAGGWKVRFAPDTPGKYSYVLKVADRTGARPETLATKPRSFTCVRSQNRGYVRVAKDRRHFEFSTGESFSPIGHNVHSSNDVSTRNCKLLKIKPEDDRGTKAYEEIFARMARNGENVVEIWMASWSLDIEWTARWKNYFGLGRYNLHHAWKLDYLLSLAEKHGIYVHLVLDNHGKLSTYVDPEWKDNPYSEENGGLVKNARDYFSQLDARAQYKKKLRYIIARWGYSPRIMGIELISEIDLVGQSYGDWANRAFLEKKAAWNRDIARHIKKIDHGRHMLTTHYSTDYGRVRAEIVDIPEIDYIALDAYRNARRWRNSGIVPLLRTTCRELWKLYDKPIWITEYGGSPFGTTLPRLEADMHAGIWAGYMLDCAGTPLLWWFMYIDKHKKYGHYRALANFARGEDRRGRKMKSKTARLSGPSRKQADGIVLKNDRSAYIWIYDAKAAIAMPALGKEPVHKSLIVQLKDMRVGAYKIEFWDTYRGRIVGKATVSATADGLTIQLPDFKTDIAVKVRPSGALAPPAAPPAAQPAAPPARRDRGQGPE